MTNTISTSANGTWAPLNPFSLSNDHIEPRTDSQTDSAWELTIDRLLSIRGFEEDWDGEGSLAPKAEVVDAAITLAQAMQNFGEPAPLFVNPTDEGNIWMEWRNTAGSKLVEVVSESKAIFHWHPKETGPSIVKHYVRRIGK